MDDTNGTASTPVGRGKHRSPRSRGAVQPRPPWPDRHDRRRQVHRRGAGYSTFGGLHLTGVGSAEEAFQEQKAAQAIAWLGQQKREDQIEDALVIANHPMRYGIDSPDEFRLWRDADPEIMIGMEGAPGAQGYAYGRNVYEGDQRGEYISLPRPDTFPEFIEEHLRTYGGWDWMTATVGGSWDSMLAEGKPFYVTSNSDSHLTAWHTWRIGDYPDTD